MARLELLRELKLRRKEIYDLLRNQSPILMDELEAIEKIISNSKGENPEISVVQRLETKGTPKGDMTWMDYVYFMLKEIGGGGKTADVAKAIVNANSDITYDRAKDASSDKLSRLLGAGKIKATKGNTKKDGYYYEII